MTYYTVFFSKSGVVQSHVLQRRARDNLFSQVAWSISTQPFLFLEDLRAKKVLGKIKQLGLFIHIF